MYFSKVIGYFIIHLPELISLGLSIILFMNPEELLRSRSTVINGTNRRSGGRMLESQLGTTKFVIS